MVKIFFETFYDGGGSYFIADIYSLDFDATVCCSVDGALNECVIK